MQVGGGGKAIASAYLPWLGQFIDGRNKKGAKFLAKSALCDVGAFAGASLMVAPFVKPMQSKGAMYALTIAGGALLVASAVAKTVNHFLDKSNRL